MRTFKKLVAVLLCAVMLFGIAPVNGILDLFQIKASAATITSHSVGDIIEFGWYPQSKVTDSSVITALNSASGEWISYNYYSGTGDFADGQMTASDYMRYKDVVYDGNKYRGVVFDSYRPYSTGYTSSASYTNQDDNGYTTGTVYWFKYEPVEWRVLDPATGMVMSETILDSQAYNNYFLYSGSYYYGDASKTYYANNYANSSIRQWLNDDFYNTAFSAAQQNIISSTSLDNSAYTDKIYLLSYDDALNTKYGFSSNSNYDDTDRRAQGSDYAKCQGISSYYGNSDWVLRSASYSSWLTCFVDYYGNVYDSCDTDFTGIGVRPALNFNLSSEIFQSDVEDSNQGSGSGIGSAITYIKDSFIITPKQNGYNENFFVLSDVECKAGTAKVVKADNRFEILDLTLGDSVHLTKSGFRDYIIPYAVAKEIPFGKGLDAYMTLDKKDGKPYISTVFAKNSSESEYQDLFNTPMVAENYNTYDIIVTGVGLSQDAVYYIAQDSSHKISSTTGIFNAEDLYSKLTLNKTVYVYAIDNGVFTDFETLSLKKSSDDGSLDKILNMSTYSLGGSGGITIKVPDENPIFGNSEISLNAFSAPITVYYDATNDTYIGTIGFDLYEYEKKDKTVSNASGSLTKFGDGETKKAFQNFKESFSYFNKKPFAEEEKDKNGKSYKEQWTSFVNRCKTASKYSQKYYDKNFSTDFLGYIEFAITEQGFTVKEASLKIGADFSYSYTYQGAVWVIPAYFKATLGATASLEGSGKRAMADRDVPFEYEITLDVEPELALEAGIGVEKLAKLGVEAKGTAPLKVEFFDQHITFKFHGEINVKTKAFVFTWDKKLCEGDLDILDKYWGKTNTYALRHASGVPQYAVSVDDEVETDLIDYYNESSSIADRSYAENTSQWLDNGIMLLTSEDSEVSVKQLQTSVLEAGKPVAVEFGDKVLMAWVEDSADRDTYNRMRLMYSVYNGTSWSTPAAVYDDGKNDDAPVLATDGENVYFAWQKINAVLDENSLVTDALQQVDICTATYDSESEAIIDAKIICSDNGYDYAQEITVEDGKPVVYFASCSDPSVAVSYNSQINKYSDNNTTSLVSSLSFVQSISADGEDMSFVIDTDGDLSTSNDINVFSYDSGYSTEFEKQDITTAVLSSYYGYIDDEKVMFVTDGANIYYDFNGERKTVFDKSQNISSLNLVEEDGKPAFLWTEDTEAGNQICYVCYDGTSWSSPVALTQAQGYYFDSLSMVNYNENLIGVFMQDELIYNVDSESYDISQVNLAYITIDDYMDLKVGSAFVEEETLVPGNTAEICVYVENLGTEKINNVEFTLSDSISDNQVTEIDIDLAPGENKNIYVDYVVPEDFTQTTLSISAVISDETDVDTTNNTIEEIIGMPDIRTEKIEYAVNGDSYIVTAYINNKSVTDASNITARLYLDEEDGSDYHEVKIDTLSSNEIGNIQFTLTEDMLNFDETDTAKVYFSVESESTKYEKTATQCLLITKSETSCAHPETEAFETIEASCTDAGRTAGSTCLVCGEIAQGGEEISATGHDYVAVVTDATCTEDGYTTYTCSECGDSYKADEKVCLGHSMGDFVVVESPNCTENGFEISECSRCSYCETREISATGHNYQDGICVNCEISETVDCDHMCHSESGFIQFFWRIIRFLQKIFGIEQYCKCGVAHY